MIWPGCHRWHTWGFNHCPFWAVGLKRQVCVTPVIPGVLLLRMYFWESLASLRVKGAESRSNNLVDWNLVEIVVVQSLSPVWLLATPWTAASQAPLSSTVSQSLLKFTFIELVMLSNHLNHLSPPSPVAFSLLSQHQGLFQWIDSSYQVAKVLEPQLQQ